MIGECVQRRAGASTIIVGGWDVFGPGPSADGDFPRRLLGGDKVIQRKTEVGLEEEEDLDEVSELSPAGGGSATESVEYCRGHGGGEEEECG